MIWKPVDYPELSKICSSLPAAFFRSERWFSHRHPAENLQLVDMQVFEKIPKRDGWFCLALFSMEPGITDFFYFIPLWVIPGTDSENTLFTKDGYAFRDGVTTAEYVSLITQCMDEAPFPTLAGSFGFLKETSSPPLCLNVHGSSSNSLLFVSERILIKNYRLIFPGINPELQLNQAMRRKGTQGVPEIYGSLQYTSNQGINYSLLLVQEWVENQGTGWHLWHRLLTGPDISFSEVLAQAAQLGKALGRFHQELTEISREQKNLTKYTFELLRRKRAEIEEFLGDGSIALSPPEIEAIVHRLKHLQEDLSRVDLGWIFRIHGDLHLDQVLKTEKGWVIIDLEGEPLKPIAERGCYDSPLKDVASMMRSFSYRLHGLGLNDEPGYEYQLTAAFLESYYQINAQSPEGWLPLPEVRRSLLEFFQLERVIYELNYELKYRPDWAIIPRNGLRRLMADN